MMLDYRYFGSVCLVMSCLFLCNQYDAFHGSMIAAVATSMRKANPQFMLCNLQLDTYIFIVKVTLFWTREKRKISPCVSPDDPVYLTGRRKNKC